MLLSVLFFPTGVIPLTTTAATTTRAATVAATAAVLFPTGPLLFFGALLTAFKFVLLVVHGPAN